MQNRELSLCCGVQTIYEAPPGQKPKIVAFAAAGVEKLLAADGAPTLSVLLRGCLAGLRIDLTTSAAVAAALDLLISRSLATPLTDQLRRVTNPPSTTGQTCKNPAILSSLGARDFKMCHPISYHSRQECKARPVVVHGAVTVQSLLTFNPHRNWLESRWTFLSHTVTYLFELHEVMSAGQAKVSNMLPRWPKPVARMLTGRDWQLSCSCTRWR
jgi:hypothetical protein